MERPHVVVINRWSDRYAEYERYADHDRNAVSYVTIDVGATAAPDSAAEVALVSAADNLPEVADAVKRLAERHGPPTAVVALKEDDLLPAAQLRAEYGCAGPSRTELLPFRDKLVMSEHVAAAGLAAPAFAPAPDAGSVRDFAERLGWPAVVKPRLSSASEGVVIVDGPEDCDQVDFDEGRPMLVQAFDPRPIYHVDGVFDGVDVGPFRASRYLNSCVGFRTGDVLGSVETDDVGLLADIADFARRSLRALSSMPTVFHLELFVDRDAGEISFLEVGARVGGAEIPFLWREVHGYDLMEAGFRTAMGLRPQPWPERLAAADGDVAGWLLFPAPAARPCRIVEAPTMLDREPGPYAEALLRPGEILPAADAYYEHVGGRFRFRGGASAEVEAAVAATVRDFRVRAEPLPAVGARNEVRESVA